MIDLERAKEAALRLIACAFKKPDARPRFSIPRRPDDDDALVMDALRELGALREIATAARKVSDELGDVDAPDSPGLVQELDRLRSLLAKAPS